MHPKSHLILQRLKTIHLPLSLRGKHVIKCTCACQHLFKLGVTQYVSLTSTEVSSQQFLSLSSLNKIDRWLATNVVDCLELGLLTARKCILLLTTWWQWIRVQSNSYWEVSFEFNMKKTVGIFRNNKDSQTKPANLFDTKILVHVTPVTSHYDVGMWITLH